MLFKLSNLNSNLALTLGYLNPASNNSAQDGRKKRTANRLCVTNVERGTRKMSGDNGTSDKVVLFFPTECSKRKFVFHSSKPSLTPVSRLRSRFSIGMKLIWTNGKRDSTTKLISPEFVQTVNRPVCPCK